MARARAAASRSAALSVVADEAAVEKAMGSGVAGGDGTSALHDGVMRGGRKDGVRFGLGRWGFRKGFVDGLIAIGLDGRKAEERSVEVNGMMRTESGRGSQRRKVGCSERVGDADSADRRLVGGFEDC